VTKLMDVKKDPNDIEVHLNPMEQVASNRVDVNSEHFVSFYDIMKHPDFVNATMHLSGGERTEDDVKPSLIRKILRDYGLDIDKKYTCRLLIHRTYSNKIYKGRRYQGKMRSDPYWVNYVYRETGVKLKGRK
jgi:hypothetical protein